MALATYAELKAAVAEWMHRSDLDSVVPTFIANAESNLSRDLNVRWMDGRLDASTIAGSPFLGLPDDLAEIQRIRFTDGQNETLTSISPDQVSTWDESATGRPRAFLVIGKELRLFPTPDAAYPLEMTGRTRIPALSDTNTYNWLLQNYPDAYLYGALVEACFYTKDRAGIALFKAKYDEAVARINQTREIASRAQSLRTDMPLSRHGGFNILNG